MLGSTLHFENLIDFSVMYIVYKFVFMRSWNDHLRKKSKPKETDRIYFDLKIFWNK